MVTVWRVLLELDLELVMESCKCLVLKSTQGNKGIILPTVEEVGEGGLARRKKRRVTDFCLS